MCEKTENTHICWTSRTNDSPIPRPIEGRGCPAREARYAACTSWMILRVTRGDVV
jgi:hypothetical protein